MDLELRVKCRGRCKRLLSAGEINAAGLCKPCANRQQREWNSKNHEQRMRNVRRSYFPKKCGITLEEYEEKLKKQKGLCLICEKPEKRKRNGRVMSLHVDHCHKTGKVRGLLCSNCNSALGKFGDSIKRLRKAIAYLEYSRDNGG